MLFTSPFFSAATAVSILPPCLVIASMASVLLFTSPFFNAAIAVSILPPDLVIASMASVLLFTSPSFSALIAASILPPCLVIASMASVLLFTSPSFSALIAVSILPPCLVIASMASVLLFTSPFFNAAIAVSILPPDLVIASMACALLSDFPLLAVICSCIFANVPSGAFNLRSAVVFCSIAVLFAVTAPPSFVSAAIASAFVCITRLFFVIAPVSPVKAAIAVSILPPCLVIASMALALLSILPVFPATRPDKAFNCCNNSSILGFAGVLPGVVTEALELAEAIFMPPAEVNKTTANIAAPVVLTTIPPRLPLLLLL